MVDFVKVRRRISYRERMQRLRSMLNKSPTREIDLRQVVKAWELTPSYVVKLLRWCAMHNDAIVYDENYGILYLKTESSPTYRSSIAQKTLEGP